MCGRFTVTAEAGAIGKAFGAAVAPLRELRLPRFNVAPTDDAPVVIAAPEGRRAGPMRWGLVPHWAESPKVGARMINARSESVATRRAYREAFLARRCLVPADGFYEWETRPAGKQPYWIHLPGRALFAMAGIWALWGRAGEVRRAGGGAPEREARSPRGARPPRKNRLATFSILTRAAPSAISRLHDRVPVILPEQTWDDWLARGTTPAALQGILKANEPPELHWHPVSRAVNRAGYDDPDCVERINM